MRFRVGLISYSQEEYISSYMLQTSDSCLLVCYLIFNLGQFDQALMIHRLLSILCQLLIFHIRVCIDLSVRSESSEKTYTLINTVSLHLELMK